jgi:hypothetical protein
VCARQTNAEHARRWRHKCAAAGKCMSCGKRDPVVPSKCCRQCLDDANTRKVRYRQRIKDDVFAAYGGYTCNCCCVSHTHEFMTIDHVNGGGNKHRKELQLWGEKLYIWLRRNNYPPGFQVLCANCNQAKRNHGECPHQTRRQEGSKESKAFPLAFPIAF